MSKSLLEQLPEAWQAPRVRARGGCFRISASRPLPPFTSQRGENWFEHAGRWWFNQQCQSMKVIMNVRTLKAKHENALWNCAVLTVFLMAFPSCGFAQTNLLFNQIVKTNLVTAPVYVREVDGKFYDTRYSQLWRNISGKILERNAGGAVIQTYVTNRQTESVWIPSSLTENQSIGAFSAGGSGGHYVDRVVSETVEPDKKIQLRNLHIGAVGQAVTIRAMMISGSKDMEIWDCGLPHKVLVVSTNRIPVIKP